MMIVQYYKVMGERVDQEPGYMIFGDEESVIGFIHSVGENTFDCVLFEAEDIEDTNIICLSDYVKHNTVIAMLKDTLIRNPKMMNAWGRFFESENINGKFEEI
jgi:hypothetical protein